MARIFDYAVFTAVPDRRRGERVNVGLVVFKGDVIDIRFKHASFKLRALTGYAWDARIEAAEQRLRELFADTREPKDVLAQFGMMEPRMASYMLR